MDNDGKDVVIGKIVSTFGCRGEVKVRPETDFPKRFELLKEALVRSRNGQQVLCIERARTQGDAVILKFAGIDDVESARALAGSDIYISKSQLMPLGPEEYYMHDIIGLEVVSVEGEQLGKVIEILRSPAHDIYVTERAMIPAVRDYVLSVDLSAGKIIVKLVEGLLL